MKQLITILLRLVSIAIAKSQPLFLPLNQEYNRSLQKSLYSNSTHFHTSIRPYFIPSIVSAGINYDSINQLLRIEKKFNKKWKQKTWDKLLNDNVATFIRKDYAIIVNPLIDFSIGNELSPSGGGAEGGGGTFVNTRGFEIKGWVGKNVGYYTNFYENQARFPTYLDTYIRNNNVIHSQG